MTPLHWCIHIACEYNFNEINIIKVHPDFMKLESSWPTVYGTWIFRKLHFRLPKEFFNTLIANSAHFKIQDFASCQGHLNFFSFWKKLKIISGKYFSHFAFILVFTISTNEKWPDNDPFTVHYVRAHNLITWRYF